MASPVLRWFLVTFSVVAGLSLLVLPTPDDRGEAVGTMVFFPESFAGFAVLVVPLVASVASVASAWRGRGREWLAAYAGVVAGTLPWTVLGVLLGVLTADLGALVTGFVAFGLIFAGVPYLVFGLPTLTLRRWALGRRRDGADPAVPADSPEGQQATAEGH